MVNYSLPPICGKIFEKLIFNPVFDFLEKNKLLSPNQSGFWPKYSCERQLPPVVNSIYVDLDQLTATEVRPNFLDISKAIDKLWHEGLLCQLKTVGISSNLDKPCQSFFSGRFQRTTLDGKSSNWSPAVAGAPHGNWKGSIQCCSSNYGCY